MTLDEVVARVEKIRGMAGDDESAHSMEDRLHVEVLQDIAGGAFDASDLAAAALKTQDIDFARWCA